jgi:DNA-binding ferritin-like protein
VPSSSELHDAEYDAEYCRKQAEETRALAEKMQDARTKSLMLGIAKSYEEMAKSYDKIANWQKRTREPK